MDALQSLEAIGDLIWKDAVVVFSVIWVYEGTRILALGVQRRRGIRILIPGVCLLLVMIGLAFLVSHTMRKVSDSMPNAAKIVLPADWGADSPPEKREFASRTLASMAYVDSGKLTTYFDAASGWKPYCPTERDVELRDQAVVVKNQLRQVESDAKSSIYRWLTFGLISALAGWFTGRKERKTLANSPVERSA